MVTCLAAGDIRPKGLLIPHELTLIRKALGKAMFRKGRVAVRGACVPSASWQGNGLPRR